MSQHNKDLLVRMNDAVWNSGDIAAVETFFAPNYVNHRPIVGTAPDREGMKEAVRLMYTAFPDYQTTITDMVAEGEKVVAYMYATGTHLGPLLTHPPSGKTMRMEAISIVRFVDGKIVERWGMADTLGMFYQLGLIPT